VSGRSGREGVVAATRKAYNDGFSDGVLLALQVLNSAGNFGGADYEELVNCAGKQQLLERAKAQGMVRLSGIGRWVREGQS
jgi:hypothetical protein